MIQSNAQLYQEINKIIIVLEKSGKTDYAIKLKDALSISTVSSEVLGELRFVFLELHKRKLGEALDIKNSVNNSLKYIHKIL